MPPGCKSSRFAGALIVTVRGALTCSADIVLSSNLPCYGAECELENLNVVNVLSPMETPSTTSTSVQRASRWHFSRWQARARGVGDDDTLCVDPRTQSGGTTCCSGSSNTGKPQCSFFGETLSFDGAKAKCDAISVPGAHHKMCQWHRMERHLRILGSIHVARCTVQSDASASAPNRLGEHRRPTTNTHFKVDNHNLFRVRWRDGGHPSPADGCMSCATHGDSCLCNVTVTEAPVFTGLASAVQQDLVDACSRWEVRRQIRSTQARTTCARVRGVPRRKLRVYLKAGSGDAPGADTIFKVTRNGSSDAIFLLNKVSTVHVGDGGLYDFQNAPLYEFRADAAAARRRVRDRRC